MLDLAIEAVEPVVAPMGAEHPCRLVPMNV